MEETLIYKFILCLSLITRLSCQKMDVNVTGTGICKGDLYTSVLELKEGLKDCVVILGSLEIRIEKGEFSDFNNTQFNNLREITEFLVVYRVNHMETVGQLFPNLTRIRGHKLFYNFALIVHDNENLREIGLYSLLKIDRGGVIVWGQPKACFIDTINWEILAPRARRVISQVERHIECRMRCTCSLNNEKNRCWNNKKCQLFADGPDAEKCHDQCLGCRKTKKSVCFACRNYTYKFNCVSKCPSNTIVVPENKYCITKEECKQIDHLVFNNTCVSECPISFKLNKKSGQSICEPCTHCEMNCSSLKIHNLADIQHAEKCININGSLTIHLRGIIDAMENFKKYLGNIQKVSDYIVIDASDVVTSLDFLSSLREIEGKKLKDGKYSLYIRYNFNLKSLFSPNVTKNLVIRKGTAHFEQNPILCMNLIDEIKAKLPTRPGYIDIPVGSNGYSSECGQVQFNFTIKTISETSVEIKFPVYNHNIYYTALYVRVLSGSIKITVPENCSEFEWYDADVPTISGKNLSVVELKALLPASTYAFCIEIYDPVKKHLTRSNIVKFTTAVGIPKPPFIFELVASTSNVIVIRWVNHRDYDKHIKYYELDVTLIEMSSRDSTVDYCKYTDDFFEADDIHHALVMRPPPDYYKACESICGVLASATPGAMVEEYFDVCDMKHFACDINQEMVIMQNTTIGSYVKTLVLNISGPRNEFQVGGLAPFSDYKFRLRACIAGQCSRSARGVVRTFSDKNADIVSVTSAHVNASGIITVKWEHPKVSNGPILTYTVEVLPKLNINRLMPQVWCLPGREKTVVVKTVKAPKYLVRVCLKTLATVKSCSEWLKISGSDSKLMPSLLDEHSTSKMDLLWTGFIGGILICIASLIIGWFKNRRILRTDIQPLVDNISWQPVESEPPTLLSDFVSFHSIPLE